MTTLDRTALEAAWAEFDQWATDARGRKALAAAITAYLESLPPQPVEVTEEMVNAACRAMEPDFPVGWNPNHALKFMRGIHRALEAALATRPSGDGIRAGRAEAGTIRVCPARDGRCPHGIDCPYSIDRYRCDMDASHRALIVPQEAVKE